MENKPNGDYRCGQLPACAPLALAYVPMQSSAAPRYENDEALRRGTLFPGLDLPFKNIVNTKLPDVDIPMAELMALGFACDELRLYLDTHKNDKEAFDLLKSLLELKKEAHKRYTEKYGPLCVNDLADEKSDRWLTESWPWNYAYPGKE